MRVDTVQRLKVAIEGFERAGLEQRHQMGPSK
jgi:hypothetical protein